MILNFGKKYRGYDIRFVPVEYLEWIVSDVDDEEVVEMAKEELQRKVDEGIIPFFNQGG
tara:strand:+ start:3014 stop:3190 length:177 start_codon:yes stop_codon:yes gene_type:complete